MNGVAGWIPGNAVAVPTRSTGTIRSPIRRCIVVGSRSAMGTATGFGSIPTSVEPTPNEAANVHPREAGVIRPPAPSDPIGAQSASDVGAPSSLTAVSARSSRRAWVVVVGASNVRESRVVPPETSTAYRCDPPTRVSGSVLVMDPSAPRRAARNARPAASRGLSIVSSRVRDPGGSVIPSGGAARRARSWSKDSVAKSARHHAASRKVSGSTANPFGVFEYAPPNPSGWIRATSAMPGGNGRSNAVDPSAGIPTVATQSAPANACAASS